MMKICTLLIPAVFFLTDLDGSILDEVRASYNKLASDKVLCEKLIFELTNTKNISATQLAYLGSLQIIWANHVFSPAGKLHTFKEGKKNIEQAIKREPHNAELRFVRLSVQKNAPSFLGYRPNIAEDTEFIRKNRDQIKSAVVQENIELLLKDKPFNK